MKKFSLVVFASLCLTISCKSKELKPPKGIEKAPIQTVTGLVEVQKGKDFTTVRIMANPDSRSKITHTVYGKKTNVVAILVGKLITVKGRVLVNSPFDKSILVTEIVTDKAMPSFKTPK